MYFGNMLIVILTIPTVQVSQRLHDLNTQLASPTKGTPWVR